MKIAFYSYMFILPVEYAWFKPGMENKQGFILTRLLTTFLIPWFQLVVWYILPAILGEMELGLELSWSFGVLYLNGLFAGILERPLQQVTYDQPTKWLIIVLIAISVFIFSVYSFIDPYIDVFLLHH